MSNVKSRGNDGTILVFISICKTCEVVLTSLSYSSLPSAKTRTQLIDPWRISGSLLAYQVVSAVTLVVLLYS